MKKIVIFNVGGALSVYGDFNSKKFLIDLGTSSEFSPVKDFLIPLSKKNIFVKNKEEKYVIDQLFISHLDRDHISDYQNFKNIFNANYMTCPNDNQNQQDEYKVKRTLLGEANDTRNMILDDMKSRTPHTQDTPLVPIIPEISLFYIKPYYCETTEDLLGNYANNISLVLFFHVGDKTVLLPGDILKEGMKYLIDNNKDFKDLLHNDGIDYLVAPHHGLQTSFSEYLFQTINGNKTRLNIISEKIREEDSKENRSDVDARYYSIDYATGENSLNQKGIKTSGGHILIDFETEETEIIQYTEIEDVINEFI